MRGGVWELEREETVLCAATQVLYSRCLLQQAGEPRETPASPRTERWNAPRYSIGLRLGWPSILI
jgi:hypothetical protein